MIDSPYGRSVEEWFGATADSMPPPHVRMRIFDRAKGICHISGRKIMPGEKWDLEHKLALCLGGENRESNLAPALSDKHKEKTAEDRAIKADLDAKRGKHILPKAKKPWSKYRKKMNGEVVLR